MKSSEKGVDVNQQGNAGRMRLAGSCASDRLGTRDASRFGKRFQLGSFALPIRGHAGSLGHDFEKNSSTQVSGADFDSEPGPTALNSGSIHVRPIRGFAATGSTVMPNGGPTLRFKLAVTGKLASLPELDSRCYVVPGPRSWGRVGTRGEKLSMGSSGPLARGWWDVVFGATIESL